MDLWIIGAAAAAGFITKRWQNFSRDGDSSSELSSGASKYEKHEVPHCYFHKSIRRKKLAEDTSTDGREFSNGRSSDTYQLCNASEPEAASTSGYSNKWGSLRNYEDCNPLSVSILPTELTQKEKVTENEDGNGLNGDKDNYDKPYMSETNSFCGSGRNRISLRSKHLYGHSIKPLSSLESCLTAQLYKEHVKMAEYVISALPLPSTTVRPLLVTDGMQIISRANVNSFSPCIGTEDNRLHEEENLCGVPLLQNIWTSDFARKNSKEGKGRHARLSNSYKMDTGKILHSQNGLRDGTVLFYLGVCFGVISSLLASRREVDKLKELLKQNENLVQDLQEELEMKESLTVKELASENYESQVTCENSFHNRQLSSFFAPRDVEDPENNDGKESCIEKAEGSSESVSKIEAELEAELERLGLNMNTFSLERRLSDVELDPDYVADFAQGELKVDMVNCAAIAEPKSNRDASGTLTTHSGNYAVSPQELSLRLHEVLESRLEERVKELEMALKNSQRKLQLMESDPRTIQRNLSWSKLRYSSGEGSPISKEDCSFVAQPLVMNLSGEALDSYNEAYEELMNMNESEEEEEDSPSGFFGNNREASLHPFDQSMLRSGNGGTNGSLSHIKQNKERISTECPVTRLKTSSVQHGSRMEGLLYGSVVSEDEDDDCEDEMLIRQIVERAKKGSPVVLNAHRVLYSMVENEH